MWGTLVCPLAIEIDLILTYNMPCDKKAVYDDNGIVFWWGVWFWRVPAVVSFLIENNGMIILSNRLNLCEWASIKSSWWFMHHLNFVDIVNPKERMNTFTASVLKAMSCDRETCLRLWKEIECSCILWMYMYTNRTGIVKQESFIMKLRKTTMWILACKTSRLCVAASLTPSVASSFDATRS